MKKYIKSNMLGPAFNLGDDNVKYVVSGCIWDDGSDCYIPMGSCVSTFHNIDDAVDYAYSLIEGYYYYDIEAVIVSGGNIRGDIEIRSRGDISKADIKRAIVNGRNIF